MCVKWIKMIYFLCQGLFFLIFLFNVLQYTIFPVVFGINIRSFNIER